MLRTPSPYPTFSPKGMDLQLRCEILLTTTPEYTYSFEIFILAILATRMHLHLWHMDQHVNGSDFVVWISMSDTSSADHTV
jgi:hypothetical protein